MPGRKTYLYPEFQNDSGWVKPVVLSEQVKNQISALIDRGLTPEEIDSISRYLANIICLRVGGKNVTAQDVKRTLASFTKLMPIDAVEKYHECDSTTRGLIYEALYCDLLRPSGENIKKAAEIALKNITQTQGGAPIKGYRRILATYALNLWKELGMKSCKHWQHPDYEPNCDPITQFLLVLAPLVDDDGKSLHPKEAVALLNEAKNKR